MESKKPNFTVDNLLKLAPDLNDYLKTEFNKYGKKIQPNNTNTNEDLNTVQKYWIVNKLNQ